MSVAGFRTGRGSAVAASAVLLAFVCASPAWSQTAAPGGKRWVIDLSAAANYDSNVARGDDTVAAARGLRKGEFTYSPNANLDITQPFLGQVLFLSGDVGYVFHQYNKDLRSQRIGLNGGVSTGFGPCGFQVTGGLGSGQSDLSDLDLRVTRNRLRTTSVGASASCTPLAGFGVTGGYTYSESRNSSELFTQDSHNEGVNLGVSYSNRLVGTVSLSGGYSKTDYDNADPTDPFAPRGFQQYNVGVSIARPIGTRLTGSAQIGYTHQDSEAGGRGFGGLTGSGSLTYRVNPRLVTTLNYRRASQASIQQGSNFVVTETADLLASYRLSSRLSASLGGHAGKRSFRGQTVILPTSLLSDKSYGASSTLSLTVGRNSALSLSAGYDHRDANPSRYDYSAYRAGVSVSTTF